MTVNESRRTHSIEGKSIRHIQRETRHLVRLMIQGASGRATRVRINLLTCKSEHVREAITLCPIYLVLLSLVAMDRASST